MGAGSTKKLFLKKTKVGKGVFAGCNFKKGEFLMRFRGPRLASKHFPMPFGPVEDHCVQIGKDLYFGPSDGMDDFVNHSCNPNSGLRIERGKADLVAIRNISRGQEVRWDYSTTMAEDGWEMKCSCGSRKCRGRIRDFKFLPKKTRMRYMELGIVPDYAIKSSL